MLNTSEDVHVHEYWMTCTVFRFYNLALQPHLQMTGIWFSRKNKFIQLSSLSGKGLEFFGLPSKLRALLSTVVSRLPCYQYVLNSLCSNSRSHHPPTHSHDHLCPIAVILTFSIETLAGRRVCCSSWRDHTRGEHTPKHDARAKSGAHCKWSTTETPLQPCTERACSCHWQLHGGQNGLMKNPWPFSSKLVIVLLVRWCIKHVILEDEEGDTLGLSSSLGVKPVLLKLQTRDVYWRRWLP
jgi:hypothetical protein